MTTEKLGPQETVEETEERHLRHLEQFFGKATEKNISFKLVKRKWFQRQAELLGFWVGGGQRLADALTDGEASDAVKAAGHAVVALVHMTEEIPIVGKVTRALRAIYNTVKAMDRRSEAADELDG